MPYLTNPQLELAEKYLKDTSVSIFLTGKAGTGKTTFLRNMLPKLDKRYVVLAPTGVAAINAGGVTIHSFFQLPLCPYLPDVPDLVTEYQMPESKRQLRKTRANIIRTLDLLVIDEISMVRADLLDSVDNSLRRYRRNNRPFGGVQLLLIGDIHQLAPVVTPDEEPYISRVYPSPFFFESKAFKRLNYVTIELVTIYRQQDMQFVELLNRVRNNQLDASTLQLLNSRYQPDIDEYVKSLPVAPIRLTTHNVQADLVNQRNLDRLPGQETQIAASVTGNFAESAYPAEKVLRLKAGAQVMFIKNDPQGSYYNGKIGTVKSIDFDEGVVFVVSDGEEIAVRAAEWENLKYDISPVDHSITQVVDGVFSQLPLRLAWAVTIHKAQGLSFDRVVVDAADAFAFGQVYVALSRCRSLDGLILSSPISAGCAFESEQVESFTSSQPSEDEVRDRYEKNAIAYYIDVLFELLSPRQLYDTAISIDQFNRAWLTNIAPAAVRGWNEWMPRLEAMNTVCDKFRVQIEHLCASACSAAETHQLLGERVTKAVAWFRQQYFDCEEALLPLLDIEIDNKARAAHFRERAEAFTNLIGLKVACLKTVAEQGFMVEHYQKAKCDYLLSDEVRKNKPKERTYGRRAASTNSRTPDNIHDIPHPDILPLLAAWRRKKSEEFNVPAFVVLHQKTLLNIARALPRNAQELFDIPGIGRNKLKQYGDEILEVVEKFCQERNKA